MDAKDTLNKVRTILGLDVILEEKLLENGTKFVAEKFEGGNEVFIATDEDEKIPVPAGEYEMEDGLILVIKEDGLIDSIEEKEKEDEELEDKDDEMTYEENLEEEDEEMNETKYPTIEEFEALKKMVEDLAGRLEAEEEEEEMEEEKEEMKSELSQDPSLIKHNPEAKKEIELTKIGKVSGTRNRVFNTIFNK